jgi:hypothetical protein
MGRYIPPKYLQPRHGEVTMKQWRIEESRRIGLSQSTLANRLKRGLIPKLKLRYVNARVVFVKI